MSGDLSIGVICGLIVFANFYSYLWLMILIDYSADGKVKDDSIVTLFVYLTRKMNIFGKLMILMLMCIPILYMGLINLIYLVVKKAMFKNKKNKEEIK